MEYLAHHVGYLDSTELLLSSLACTATFPYLDIRPPMYHPPPKKKDMNCRDNIIIGYGCVTIVPSLLCGSHGAPWLSLKTTTFECCADRSRSRFSDTKGFFDTRLEWFRLFRLAACLSLLDRFHSFFHHVFFNALPNKNISLSGCLVSKGYLGGIFR